MKPTRETDTPTPPNTKTDTPNVSEDLTERMRAANGGFNVGLSVEKAVAVAEAWATEQVNQAVGAPFADRVLAAMGAHGEMTEVLAAEVARLRVEVSEAFTAGQTAQDHACDQVLIECQALRAECERRDELVRLIVGDEPVWFTEDVVDRVKYEAEAVLLASILEGETR